MTDVEFILGMFISVIFPNRQPTFVNRLLTINRQDYFKLEHIYIYIYIYIYIQPQIRKSWDSMENANKKRK